MKRNIGTWALGISLIVLAGALCTLAGSFLGADIDTLILFNYRFEWNFLFISPLYVTAVLAVSTAISIWPRAAKR